MRAQRKVSKDRPNTPPQSCSVVTYPQVQCEAMCDRTLNQTLFRWISIHTGPHTWQNRINQQLWTFEVPWSPNFVIDLPPRSGFWKKIQATMNTQSNRCHVRIHANFTSNLAFTYILHWSLKRSVNRTWTGLRLSHQRECSKRTGHGLSVSCVKRPYESHEKREPTKLLPSRKKQTAFTPGHINVKIKIKIYTHTQTQ